MDATKLSALLGRPLTSYETTNVKTYLNIAKEELGTLLCTSLCDQDDPKVYDIREGYSTVFTDIFTDLDEVKLDGILIDSSKYSVRQWDKRSGSWYNSIVFDRRMTSMDSELEVTASWGFSTVPSDLQLLLARIFDHVTKQNQLDRTINSKKTEDFAISFNHSSITMDDSLWESLVKDNSSVVAKYSRCDIPNVQHGGVC